MSRCLCAVCISEQWMSTILPVHEELYGVSYIFFPAYPLIDVAGLRLYTLQALIRSIMSLWSCPTCPKSFARKGDLTRHQLIHAGIKPHRCTICDKRFRQSSGLRTHENVHSKAKPYKCGIGSCKKAFGDPSSCSRHRKETHRREGAYKCIITECGTRIKRRSAFVAHLRKHGLDPKSIDLDAIVSQSNEGGSPAPAHFAASDVESKSHDIIGSRSASPSSLCDSRQVTLRKITDGWMSRLTVDGPSGPQRTIRCSWIR
ncbi:hypothetical protein V8E55_002002 [Tylopilus felleus]